MKITLGCAGASAARRVVTHTKLRTISRLRIEQGLQDKRGASGYYLRRSLAFVVQQHTILSMRKWYVTLSLALLTLSQQALACPGCKDALSQKGAATNPWGAAFNLSIMFMLGTVLTIVCGAKLFFRKMVRVEELQAAGNVSARKP